jgi:hypothetical protein
LVPVLAEATVQAPLTVKPALLKLDDAKPGVAVSRRVNVFGSKPFKIVAIDGLGDGIQAEIPQKAATVHTLTFTCVPPAAGELKRQLQIRSDLPGQAPVSIVIEGAISP